LIMLLNTGVNINLKNNFGTTALIAACNSDKNNNKVKILLEAGADPHLKNNFQKTAIIYAYDHHCTQNINTLNDFIFNKNLKNLEKIKSLEGECQELKNKNYLLKIKKNILKQSLECHPNAIQIKELSNHFSSMIKSKN